MEYIPGQDLADYIIANGRLGEAEALNYIDQIAQALDCVHQQKFFHRDVKPHNIMLRQDRGEAVLIDFGIAKEFVDLETIYLSNSLGTELYKPIEQYEKRGQFGAYTDIYALAVTLYHLLTGAAPGGGSPLYWSKARKDAQDNGGGEQIEKCLWEKLANAGVSERTQVAIKAGMEIDPSQRPQNMTAFRELLELHFKLLINASTLDNRLFTPEHRNKAFDKNSDAEVEMDTFDRDLEAISLDGLDENPFAGLEDLIGDETVCFPVDEKEQMDTFDRDLEAINLYDFDDDPFAGLADLLGEETEVGQAVQSFFARKDTPTIERNDVSGDLYSEGQITLLSPSPTQAYAHWEIPFRLKRQLREQGGQKLLLRLYDVTDIDYGVTLPANFQEFQISESDWDVEISIKQANRRYLTEIGYITGDRSWLLLARSRPLWIGEGEIANNYPNQPKSSLPNKVNSPQPANIQKQLNKAKTNFMTIFSNRKRGGFW